MSKKLKTKIEFTFDEQEEVPEFNVDMKLKTRKKQKHIKIVEHKNKKKAKDVSTNLF